MPQVIEGYENACKKALEILPDCVCSSAKDLHDVNEATSLIRTAVISKQYGNEDFLANLIAQACGESAIQITWTKLEDDIEGGEEESSEIGKLWGKMPYFYIL